MDELRALAACAGGEVVPFYERDFEPTTCCVEGDPTARGAPTDDDEVVDLAGGADGGGSAQAGDLLEAGGDGGEFGRQRGVGGGDLRVGGFRRKGPVECIGGQGTGGGEEEGPEVSPARACPEKASGGHAVGRWRGP